MTDDISNKWNARYAKPGDSLPAPAEVLIRGERWLPEPASESASESALEWDKLTALDLACGRAANAEWLGQRGFQVSAWDISDAVIADIRKRTSSHIADAQVRDVSAQPPLARSFDVIVVCRFLDRSLCPAIAKALKPGGTLFYQTFTHGLSNPDYLLGSNELLSLFDSLNILEYHEPEPDKSGKAEARLIARSRDTIGAA